MASHRNEAASRPLRAAGTVVIMLALGLGICVPAGAKEPPAAPRPPSSRLVIGVFPVGADAVVDGDTLRMLDGGPSVRVPGIDTEELYRNAKDEAAATADFAAYAKAKRGDHPRPVKFGTPAGLAAKAFVAKLFEGVKSVRLERDAVGARTYGTYGRRLAHVFLLAPSGEIHLAAELIRQGHSPYFQKYGRSRRFHDLFEKAEQEARTNRRGIWGSEGPAHYPDYAERCAWWRGRAEQVERWRQVAHRADHVTLGAPDADRKLRERLGRSAVVFGLFDRELPVKSGDRWILLLGHVRRRGLPLVFFSRKVFDALDRGPLEARYVTVRGTVTQHRGRPQIVIEKIEQISTK